MMVLIRVYQAICIFRSDWNYARSRFSKVAYACDAFYFFVSIFLLFFPLNRSLATSSHAIQSCVLIIVNCRTTTATKQGI